MVRIGRMQQEFRISHQISEEHNKGVEPTRTATGSHTVVNNTAKISFTENNSFFPFFFSYCRSSHRRCSVRTPEPEASNFIKKKTLAQMFSCEFCEISKNTFFTEHLQATASANMLLKLANSYVSTSLQKIRNILSNYEIMNRDCLPLVQ